MSLIEVLAALACLAVVAAMSVPGITAALDRSRAHAAARHLNMRMALARSRAAARGTTVALRLQGVGASTTVGMYADGNGNGVRTLDIARGIDAVVAAPVTFSDLFPGVTLVLTDDAPELMSFTPLGTATSGTVEVRSSGGARFGVRVLGMTGRSRVARFDAARGEWVDAW
jgi:Tfp pilus assembly protein FimT